MGALVQVSKHFNAKQMQLMQVTVAKDTTPAEFDQFLHMAAAVRLDPLKRQIYCIVYGREDKRKVTYVTAISGYRTIADRTGCYRPGNITVHYDERLKDPAINPQGISHATATVYKRAHGEWHEFSNDAYWDEFAPIVDEWENRQKTGRKVLDTRGQWGKMGRVMISKCAEAGALRRGWPDDLAGLYVEDEMDQARVIDLTPTEIVEEHAKEQRLQLVGGPGVMIDWMDGKELEKVAFGKLGDRALAWIKDESPMTVHAWASRNRDALKEYWGHDKAGALEVRRAIDARIDEAQSEAAE